LTFQSELSSNTLFNGIKNFALYVRDLDVAEVKKSRKQET